MDEHFSISKGVFSYRGKKNKLEPGYSRNLESKLKIGRCLCEIISKKFKEIHENLMTNVCKSITNFVIKSNIKSKCNQFEIPVAAFVMGINVSEHESIAKYLSDDLKEHCTSNVVIVSNDSISTNGQFYKLILEALTGYENTSINYTVLEETYEDVCDNLCMDDTNKSFSKITSTKASFADLLYWHQENNIDKPIVIIIPHSQSFPRRILEDFIILCNSYLGKLPVTLILGLSTAIATIHRILSHTVTSLMSIETFYAPSPAFYISEILEKVILNSLLPCKMLWKPLHFVIENFLNYNFSVKNFEYILKFSVMSHFFNNELSVFCLPLNEAKNKINKSSKFELKYILQTKSFQRYLNDMEENKSKFLIKDKFKQQELICKLFDEYYYYEDNILTVIKCLLIFVKRVPQCSLGINIRDIYEKCLKTDLSQTFEYTENLRIFNNFSMIQIKECLLDCCKLLENNESFYEHFNTLQQFYDKLDEIKVLDFPVKQKCDENENQLITLPHTNLSALRDTLIRMKEKKMNKKMSAFESIRQECLNYMHLMFSKYLLSPKSVTLYEIFYSKESFMDEFCFSMNRDPFLTPARRKTNLKADDL